MRTRVLAVLLAFVVLATAGFALPLLSVTATERTQQLLLARTADVDRFAALADQAVAAGDASALLAEVTRYTELYGEGIVVVTARRAPVAETGGLAAADPAVAELIDAALRNQPSQPAATVRPWSRTPVLLARPAGTGTKVSGAVVLRASVTRAADDVRRSWFAVLAGAALVTLAGAGLALGATRWVLGPMRRLDRAVGDLTAGLRPVHADLAGPPELRQLTAGFNRMSDAVTAALDQQRRLVADTSHQMRNPMTALRLRVDALGPSLPASAARTYEGAVGELDRLEALLDDLLTLAAAEHRAGELAVSGDSASCDAAAVAEAQVHLWQPAAERAGVRLRFTGEPPRTAEAQRQPAGMTPHLTREPLHAAEAQRATGEPPRAAATEAELAQVLDVLLDNALKYAPGAEVSVSCGVEGAWAVVSVADAGPGLSAEELAQAQARFWRADRHRGLPGTGLGLAIAERLTAGRGGRIELRAADPHGLVVRVLLPRAEADGS
ncbi:HAMP domain-containing sensor histidine kinase [Amycolatopsis sp. KNN50.9b]|uniref:sensor histidine kinase n=2 Tax=Amycolatopsis TaxID=1813 RepID=UPI000B8AC9C0|nr:HAMP domain-containing sensor histidine kinase [Amycolatopsis sp. KNN50.9b]OXM74759.1 two-component sensor histidine kinase [Amycolatopsis sp. KNN50.9b]